MDTVEQSSRAPWLRDGRDSRPGSVQWWLGAELCPGELNPAGPTSALEPWLCPRRAPGAPLGDALPGSPARRWKSERRLSTPLPQARWSWSGAAVAPKGAALIPSRSQGCLCRDGQGTVCV